MHEAYDKRIVKLAKAKCGGDPFRREELRSEMHVALPGILENVKYSCVWDGWTPGNFWWISAALATVADAYNERR